jgi:ADP-heptose:LPS heptosyltransferase
MKILALQLKRIGDLVLTTPALRALNEVWPGAHVTLGVMEGTAALLPTIPSAQAAIVFGPGRGFAPWQQMLTGGWDVCLDFTGNDRSALAATLSRAKKRVAFDAMRRNKLRSFAYNAWSPSQVREVHTAQHYLDLVAHVAPCAGALSGDLFPELVLPVTAAVDPARARYALLHPGTARPEKYWLAARWGEVAAHLRAEQGLEVVFSCGPDAFESTHVARASSGGSAIESPRDLLALAKLVAGARIVVSCDTAVVHLAAAFRVPQIALFGPTNPFHWRPLHERAVVLSAAQPDAPLTEFTPRMRGAPMERISTAAVIRAIDSVLASPR